jgi:hypothetical protein
VAALLADPEHGNGNRGVFTRWLDTWTPTVDAAAEALAAVFDLDGIDAPEASEALKAVRAEAAAIRTELAI